MLDNHELDYIITHVFLPPKLPQKGELDRDEGKALIDLITEAAAEWKNIIPSEERPDWEPIVRMLHHLRDFQTLSEGQVASWITQMHPGGTSTPFSSFRIYL